MNKRPYKVLLDINFALPSKNNSKTRDRSPKDLHSTKLKKLVAQFREFKEFQCYKLSYIDILLIAFMWNDIVSCRRRKTNAMSILKIICDSPSECIDHLDIIIDLLHKNVLYTPEKSVYIRKHRSDYNRSSVNYSKHSLLEEHIELNSTFVQLILGDKEEVNVLDDEAYLSNTEFIDDWFSYLSKLHDFSRRNIRTLRRVVKLNNFVAMEYLEVMEWKNRIKKRLEKTDIILPLIDLVEEYKLDENEETILVYLIQHELEGIRCYKETVIQLISSDTHEMYRNNEYISEDSKLVKNGLVEISETLSFLSKGNDIRISPDIMRRVITKTPVTDEERIMQIIKGNNIFSLVEPTQTFDELILPDEMKKTIKFSLNQYSTNVDSTLRKWKLYDEGMCSAGNSNKDLEPGMLMLFHGSPGTGKTFAAAAIAQAMGKKLLITDVSRIQSKWVGDSEKNVRRMFTIFERIVRRVKNPPVLLLNEADQFLTKRLSNTRSSVDKMYNSLQNIFLEAFENLRGVLIATTNLRGNLDEAFSRRFHLKLEFPFPTFNERTELWKLHIPATIPGFQSININSIANRYRLTGGQIKVIVRNACVEAASRAGSQKRLLQKDLIKYCEIETISCFEKRKTIGF